MKNLFLCALLSALFPLFLTAQAPDTLWTKTYGGIYDDYGYCVKQTTEGGYIITGYTYSFGAGNRDVYLIKTNADGDTLWTRFYGGAGTDAANSVEEASDSGYLIAGYTSSFGTGAVDMYLIKTTADGDTLWTKTYGGANIDEGWSVQQTSDNGYIIVGWTESFGPGYEAVYLIKTDTLGDTLWTKTYGGPGVDQGWAVRQTSDDGYIIAGYTNSFGAGRCDMYLIKTTADGDTLWTRTYGGAEDDFGCSIQQTSDGGYIVAGITESFGSGYYDVYLVKTNANGDTLWTKTYGGPHFERGYSVQETHDNGYVIAGWTMSFGAGGFDAYLVKTDANGDTLWTKTYGGTEDDFGNSLQATSDGGYIIAGRTESFGSGNYDVYLIKTAPDTTGVREENIAPIRYNVCGAAIFSGPLFLPEGKNCRVFDITGRVVKPDKTRPGIYFVEVNGRISQKVVKIR